MSVLVVTPSPAAAEQENQISFSMASRDLVLLSKTQEFRVEIVGDGDLGDIYVGHSIRDSGNTDEPWLGETFWVDVRWESRVSPRALTLTFDPLTNGSETFVLFADNVPPITFTITVNFPELDAYYIELDPACEQTLIGRRAGCSVSGEAIGPGAKKSLPVVAKVWYRFGTIGNWKYLTQGQVGDGTYFNFYTPFLTGPLQLRTTYDGVDGGGFWYLNVAPTFELAISAPGAAIVGQSFSVTVKTDKRVNGTCDIGNALTSMKKGVASARIYGRRPGSIRIYVTCTAPGWARVTDWRDIWIRG